MCHHHLDESSLEIRAPRAVRLHDGPLGVAVLHGLGERVQGDRLAGELIVQAAAVPPEALSGPLVSLGHE
eukprot:826896-Pyramimonas_sp.AAC.1